MNPFNKCGRCTILLNTLGPAVYLILERFILVGRKMSIMGNVATWKTRLMYNTKIIYKYKKKMKKKLIMKMFEFLFVKILQTENLMAKKKKKGKKCKDKFPCGPEGAKEFLEYITSEILDDLINIPGIGPKVEEIKNKINKSLCKVAMKSWCCLKIKDYLKAQAKIAIINMKPKAVSKMLHEIYEKWIKCTFFEITKLIVLAATGCDDEEKCGAKIVQKYIYKMGVYHDFGIHEHHKNQHGHYNSSR
tara:strand:+ start:1 stop:741 length:741 start_codon:yes stop_codon:yes gene_type:complete